MYMFAFDLEHVKVNLGSFGALFRKKGRSSKTMSKVILGFIWWTCLNMVCNSKRGVSREKRSEIWKSGVAVNRYMGYLRPVGVQGHFEVLIMQ